jgi:hypothetical protein
MRPVQRFQRRKRLPLAPTQGALPRPWAMLWNRFAVKPRTSFLEQHPPTQGACRDPPGGCRQAERKEGQGAGASAKGGLELESTGRGHGGTGNKRVWISLDYYREWGSGGLWVPGTVSPC